MLPALLEESASTSLEPRRARRGIGLLVLVFALGLSACGGGERQDEDEPEAEFPVEIVSAGFPPKQRLAETTQLTLSVSNVGDEAFPDLAITVFTEANDGPDDEVSGEAGDDTGSAGATDAEGGPVPEEDSDSASPEQAEDEQALPEARGAFSVLSRQPDLAIPSRPVWILEQGFPRVAGTDAGPAPPGEISGSGGTEAVQTNTFSFGALDPNETREVVFRVTPVQPGTYTVRYRIAAGLQGKAVAVNQDGSVPEGEFVVQISNVPPQSRVDDSGKVVPIEPGDIIGQAGTEEQKQELGE